MTCEQHDQLAAGSQFVTHLTGRLLAKLKLQPSAIATQGFRSLLHLVDNTCKARATPPLPSGLARAARICARRAQRRQRPHASSVRLRGPPSTVW